MRTLGVVYAIFIALGIAAMWIFVTDSLNTKIIASLSMFVVAAVILLCTCVTSYFAVVEIRDRKLSFYFCGIRTRSIPLNPLVMFDFLRTGRIESLVIVSGRSRYVPNSALDRGQVVELLCAHGVMERKEVAQVLRQHGVLEELKLRARKD